MKKGGNAVDAAIGNISPLAARVGVVVLMNVQGTAVCIGVVNSFASGVGGGGFMVVRESNGRSKAYNFRETAPGNASRDMYNSPSSSSTVPLRLGHRLTGYTIE